MGSSARAKNEGGPTQRLAIDPGRVDTCGRPAHVPGMTDEAEAPPRVIEGGPLRYLLSAPPAPGGGLPVLFFLHGYDEAAPMAIDRALTLHGPLRATSRAHARGCIVVAPQLPSAGDVWHRHADDVRRIVADVQGRHGGDPRRTYLTGFSFGGNGVFDLALAQPDLWAALWAVDPTRAPLRPLDHPVWLSFGEIARSRKRHFMEALGLRDAAADATGDRLGLDLGEDHVGSATTAYQDPRIYAWLLAHRRQDGASRSA